MYLKFNMSFNEINSEELNQKFIDACSYGNYEAAQSIYNEHYINPNSFIGKCRSFLKLSKYPTIILDPYFKNNSAFNSACQFGQEHIVDFLLNDKKFMRNMSYKDLSMGFSLARDEYYPEVIKVFLDNKQFYNEHEFLSIDLHRTVKYALSDGSIDILNCIKSFVTEKEKYFDYDEVLEGFLEACCNGYLNSIRFCMEKLDRKLFDHYDKSDYKPYSKSMYNSVKDQGFVKACENGHLNVVKYIVEEMDHFNIDTNPELDDFACRVINSGFMFACSNGHIDIVKYFTNEKESLIHIDVKQGLPYYAVNDTNLKVLRYFIFDLGLKKEEFFDSIPYAAEELFKIKNTHDELQIKLNNKESQTHQIPTKRLKI